MQMQQGRAAFANDEQIALGVEVEPLGLKADVTGQLGEFGVADRDEAPGADRPAPDRVRREAEGALVDPVTFVGQEHQMAGLRIERKIREIGHDRRDLGGRGTLASTSNLPPAFLGWRSQITKSAGLPS